MLATNLSSFVFTGGFTLGEFLQQSSHGLAGGVEGIDGVERFLFRGTTELGHGRLPCFSFRLIGLRFGVGQQAGEEVRGQGSVLLFGLIVPEDTEQGGAWSADGASEFVQVIKQLRFFALQGLGVPRKVLGDRGRIQGQMGEAFLE